MLIFVLMKKKHVKNSCGSQGCDARRLTLPYSTTKHQVKVVKKA